MSEIKLERSLIIARETVQSWPATSASIVDAKHLVLITKYVVQTKTGCNVSPQIGMKAQSVEDD